MSFVHSSSEECTKSELDLFSVPPTQVTLEKGHGVDHLPGSSVADGGSITFLCPSTEDSVDLSKTILVVRAKVTKANGDNLDADEKVGIVNNFLYSLFKQVDVFLKEKQVMQATGTYAYRAYLETLLSRPLRTLLWLLPVLTQASQPDTRLANSVKLSRWRDPYSATCL